MFLNGAILGLSKKEIDRPLRRHRRLRRAGGVHRHAGEELLLGDVRAPRVRRRRQRRTRGAADRRGALGRRRELPAQVRREDRASSGRTGERSCSSATGSTRSCSSARTRPGSRRVSCVRSGRRPTSSPSYQGESHHARRVEGEQGARWGSGEGQIVHVELLDGAGQPQTVLTTLEPVTIGVEVTVARAAAGRRGRRSHRHLERRPGVGMEHPTGPAGRSGGWTARLASTSRSPALPLLEGVYDLTVALTDHTEMHPYDHWERRIRFEVRQYRSYDVGRRAHPCRVDDQRHEVRPPERSVAAVRRCRTSAAAPPAAPARARAPTASFVDSAWVSGWPSIPVVRPGDPDGRVEGVHAVLAAGRVRRRAQVDDGRPAR